MSGSAFFWLRWIQMDFCVMVGLLHACACCEAAEPLPCPPG